MDTPGIGHNNSDDPLAKLAEATEPLKARVLELRVALERVPDEITPDIEGLVSDQLRQATVALKNLDIVRDFHKRPHDQLAKKVQRHCKDIEALIGLRTGDGAFGRVRARFDAYQDRRENDAQAAHEAKRRALAGIADTSYRQAEALGIQAASVARNATNEAERMKAGMLADRAAEAQRAADAAADALERMGGAAAHDPIRGEASMTVRRAHTTFEITDPLQVPDHYWSVDRVRIQAAIDAGVEDIPGVTIKTEHVSSTLGR